jgi:hypothetical protein
MYHASIFDPSVHPSTKGHHLSPCVRGFRQIKLPTRMAQCPNCLEWSTTSFRPRALYLGRDPFLEPHYWHSSRERHGRSQEALDTTPHTQTHPEQDFPLFSQSRMKQLPTCVERSNTNKGRPFMPVSWLRSPSTKPYCGRQYYSSVEYAGYERPRGANYPGRTQHSFSPRRRLLTRRQVYTVGRSTRLPCL